MTFAGCKHLASVAFGEHSSITNLGVGASQDCLALTNITLPDKLKVIEDRTFSHCTALERVVFNKNLKTIVENAFQFCSALKSITLPDKLKVIDEDAFTKCTSLERVASSATNISKLSVNAHSMAAPNSKMSNLHPARFLSVFVHSLGVIA